VERLARAGKPQRHFCLRKTWGKEMCDRIKKLLAGVFLVMILVCGAAPSVEASSGVGIEVNPDTQHSAPGKTVEYTVTVYNYEPEARFITLEIDRGNCNISWFEWTRNHILVPAHGVTPVSLTLTPDRYAIEGTYTWCVVARTAEEAIPASATAAVVVQNYDYASVTHVEGEGYFTIDQRVRSIADEMANQHFGVNVDKHFLCKGEIEGFVSDEYLLEGALGNNPNFEHMSAVSDYTAIDPGDFLYGDENIKSSFVFGGTGTRIQEHYDVQKMDTRLENVNLHSTGYQRYKSELATLNDFGGYFLLDAKQSVPGYAWMTDREEFLGNFTFCKHLIFRRPDEPLFNP
jgi:hypothetical protein